ncbi:elongation of fatty acids protein 3-like [Magnolia sinica]|uniref:elongation of fatty acids protein 3-like n=1 Tax=Magnolia sinica TaxID=86752 RepID=UPI0026589569|nr:elongation of fatty acids protein 3-like [Magnolia sinica]
MELLYANLRHWLVGHPAIANFRWIEHQTWGASPQFLVTALLSYLALTLLLHLTLPKSPSTSASPPTPFLRLISAVHNLALLLISFTMAVGCSLSSISQMPNPSWLFCFPSNATPPSGPVFFWAYIFYLSKLLEFSDTLLILFNPNKRLTFLHVYHHALVVLMCYLWLHASQSLMPVALATNASVHTLMYGYYLLCSIGKRPRWKRMVTDCQIVQFVFSFGCSVVMMWLHFARAEGGGCSGLGAWAFNAGFNASLLLLFLNFHSKNYGSKEDDKWKKKQR